MQTSHLNSLLPFRLPSYIPALSNRGQCRRSSASPWRQPCNVCSWKYVHLNQSVCTRAAKNRSQKWSLVCAPIVVTTCPYLQLSPHCQLTQQPLATRQIYVFLLFTVVNLQLHYSTTWAHKEAREQSASRYALLFLNAVSIFQFLIMFVEKRILTRECFMYTVGVLCVYYSLLCSRQFLNDSCALRFH